MDRDQRSRQQKSRGGSFARPAQKRSLGSRMGLQKQAPPRQRPGPQPKPPRRPQPQARPPGTTMVCPTSPAKPSCPYRSWPFTTMPLPNPVPRVMTAKSFMPLAPPYIISPRAAALASFVRNAGRANVSLSNSVKGIRPFQFKLAACSIVPVK